MKNRVREALRFQAKKMAYRSRSNMVWKQGFQIVTGIYLQRSQWDNGIYVNFGFSLRSFMINNAPMNIEYWPMQERAESFESPYRNVFAALSSDINSEQVSNQDLNVAIIWLLKWLEKELVDEHALRRSLADPDSWLMRRGPMHDGMLGDWYRGELSDFFYYYPNYNLKHG